jgi:hypothetical protein
MSRNERRSSVSRELHRLASTVESLRMIAKGKLSGACHGENITELAVVMAGSLHVLRDRIRRLEMVLKER